MNDEVWIEQKHQKRRKKYDQKRHQKKAVEEKKIAQQAKIAQQEEAEIVTAKFDYTPVVESFDKGTKSNNKRNNNKKRNHNLRNASDPLDQMDSIYYNLEMDEPVVTKPKNKKKKKKKPAKVLEYKGPTFIEALSDIDAEHLLSLTKGWDFDDRLVALRMLGEYFENSVTDVWNTFDMLSGDSHDEFIFSYVQPSCYLTSETVDVVTEFVGEQPEPEILKFCLFLLKIYLNRDKSIVNFGLGVITLLHVIVKQHPHILIDMIPVIQKTYMEQAKVGYLLNKAYGREIIHLATQVIHTHPGIALYAWLELILPSVHAGSTSSSLTLLGVEYISMVMENKNLKKFRNIHEGEAFVSPNSVELILRMVHGRMRAAISSQMQSLYNQIIEYTIAPNKVTARYYFVDLFEAAGEEDIPTEKRNEILYYLSLAVATDRECYDLWKENHISNLTVSNNLMVYMAVYWEAVYQLCPQSKRVHFTSNILDLLNELEEINESIDNNKLASLGITHEGLETCGKSIIELRSTLSGKSSFRGFAMFLSFLFTFILLIILLNMNGLVPAPLQSFVDQSEEFISQYININAKV
eukprot:TRINITY_DN10634_c0_g1_i1.p1 TRINITY_DN10634_c0_g1~~TRINITY_DN10634_c0_g1_i1.p1  ORF type:complete len:590 (-),score=128.62 TRINITY_DN10634_c0_g1_i1:29-1765(-)